MIHLLWNQYLLWIISNVLTDVKSTSIIIKCWVRLIDFREIKLFDADNVLEKAKTLKDEMETQLEHRQSILRKAKAGFIAMNETLLEGWEDHLGQLEKISAELRCIPAASIEQFEQQGWVDSFLAIFSSRSCHYKAIGDLNGRLSSMKIDIQCRSQQAPPSDFSLSNIQQIVKWCEDQCAHTEERIVTLQDNRNWRFGRNTWRPSDVS